MHCTAQHSNNFDAQKIWIGSCRKKIENIETFMFYVNGENWFYDFTIRQWATENAQIVFIAYEKCKSRKEQWMKTISLYICVQDESKRENKRGDRKTKMQVEGLRFYNSPFFFFTVMKF